MVENKNNNNPIELNDAELEQVAGGAVYVNANTQKVGFSSKGTVYKYKNCTVSQIRDLCESLAGQFATEAEYDAACEAAMKANGWI